MTLPAGWTTVPVTWEIGTIAGNVARGSVSFVSSYPVTVDGDTYVPEPINANVVNGVMAAVSLPSTDDPDISPTGWTYRVIPSIRGAQLEPFEITVPAAGGPINLATVVPVEGVAAISAVALADGALALLLEDTESAVRASLRREYVRAAQADSAFPITAYGHSNAVVGPGWHSTGNHYLQLLRDELGAGTLTSYAVSGQRILHVLCSLVNETAIAGTAAPLAGSEWPGTSSRGGLVVLDIVANDTGRYANMTVSPLVPQAIPAGSTVYLDAMAGAYRAALALLSSEARVEQIESASVVYGGTWNSKAQGSLSSSGGSFAWTTNTNATVDFTLTAAQIPQTGPLAGKVFALVNTFSTNAGGGVPAGMAPINWSVDGGSVTAHAVKSWERYVGIGSINVDSGWDCIPITVPTDGASHTVRLAHGGIAGQRFDPDCILLPSTDPNPILVMGHDRQPEVHGAFFNAAAIAAFANNTPLVQGRVRSVVSEFPNAIWVPSTMTSNGLYSGDKIHPNDRGMLQRKNDAEIALQAVRARLESRALALLPDGDFMTT